MDLVNVCRCCLSQGSHKDVNLSYVWLDKKEIYSDMLLECFNIALSISPYSSTGICDACISCLRSSLAFKQQVVQAEQEFLKRFVGSGVIDEKPTEIKLEPKQSSDDDSDDYFLADAVKEVNPDKIKEESREPIKKKAQKRTKKATKKKDDSSEEKKHASLRLEKRDGSWKSEKIKTLVTRLATSLSSSEFPELTIKKKKSIDKTKRKLTISSDYKDPRIKLMWTSRNRIDKSKHKENLQTILEFSNAVPFKNKSLLGFICGYCESPFPDPIDLRKHTETDHKIERLNFKSNFDMTEYNVKLDITDLTCTLCDEKPENLNILKEHLIKVHNKTIHSDIKDHILQFKLKKGDVYDCAMCSATYETFKMLKQHMNKHYSNYTCSKCQTSFATKRSLNAHRTTHQEGSFKCDHCDKVFPSRSKKHYHQKIKHLGARNISNCPYCNEPFRSYYQRNQHLVKVHNSEAQYKCNVCNKSFILKSLLMYHIKKNHLMERNCQCTECGYRFFSKKALKAHMVKHTGERNFSCEVCHKSYARKYTLREHMRIHNNDRRFKCEVCAMSFVQKCSLKSHLLSNHGISMAASDITCSI